VLLLKIQILKYISILRFEFLTRLEFDLYRANTRVNGQGQIVLQENAKYSVTLDLKTITYKSKLLIFKTTKALPLIPSYQRQKESEFSCGH